MDGDIGNRVKWLTIISQRLKVLQQQVRAILYPVGHTRLRHPRGRLRLELVDSLLTIRFQHLRVQRRPVQEILLQVGLIIIPFLLRRARQLQEQEISSAQPHIQFQHPKGQLQLELAIGLQAGYPRQLSRKVKPISLQQVSQGRHDD